MEKKIKLTKQSFKYFFLGERMVWLSVNDNFLKMANQFSILKSIDSYRYKRLTIPNYKTQIGDIPATILDGNEISELSKDYYRVKYPDYKVVDFSNNFDIEFVEAETSKLLKSEEDVIIFEAGFRYNDFTLRTDVLIKVKNKVSIVEVKATTEPAREHMYDVAYQHFILSKVIDPTFFKNWIFRIMTLNRDFVLLKNSVKDQIIDFFKITGYYYNSSPTYDEFGLPKTKSLDLLENILNLQSNYDFDYIFDKIKQIQLQDDMPKEWLSEKINLFGANDFLPFLKEYERMTDTKSLFNYRGDAGFTIQKKAELFYEHGLKFIEEVDDKYLIPKKVDYKEVPSPNSSGRYSFLRANNLLRLIQKDVTISNKTFIDKKMIRKHLSKYKTPIYMFDFEAVNLAQPRTKFATPYEQVPYQYSIHVIHDIDNFDYETLEGITHLEYLPKDNKQFYEELFVNLVEDLTKFGIGTYVAFNKTFEQMVIKNALKPIKKLDEKILDKLKLINDNIIDLMIPFKKMHYYDYLQKGSYSIKYIAPIFSKLNYQDLNEIVRKGDQSAAQAKNWLMRNDEESQKHWENIRNDMLEYCKYDTLSMVAIFQGLIKLIN